MAQRIDTSINRLDDAARAGWLYYVAGNTQEEIAAKLGIEPEILATKRVEIAGRH